MSYLMIQLTVYGAKFGIIKDMEDFILHQKTYDTVVWIYPIINKFPKNHRAILGKHIEELSVTLLLEITKANKVQGKLRLEHQHLASDTLDCLRTLLRLSKDCRLMSVKQYVVGAEKLNEVGRMLSGWMHATKPV